MKFIPLAVMIALLSSPAAAASFDCAKAATTVEKIVCADKEISALDDELNKLYQQRLAVALDQQGMKSMQRNWLKSLGERCKDAECVKMDYDIQVETLKGPVSEEFSFNYKTPVEKRISVTGQSKDGFNFRLTQTNVDDGSVICSYPKSDDAPPLPAKFDGKGNKTDGTAMATWHSAPTGCSMVFNIKHDKITSIDLVSKGCEDLCDGGEVFDDSYPSDAMMQ